MGILRQLLDDDPVVILDEAKRTPRADTLTKDGLGLFNGSGANQLGSIALRAVLRATGIKPDMIGHLIMGSVGHAKRDAWYGGRHVGLSAGVNTPAVTVNRLCGSGVEAIRIGVMQLLLESTDHQPFVAVVAAEQMNYPHLVQARGRNGVKFGPANLLPGTVGQDTMTISLYDPFAGMAMANTAERLGRQEGITRGQCDQFALRSHGRAKAARDAGHFDEEIVAVSVPMNGGVSPMDVCRDTHIRDDITLDGLANLRSAFEPGGMITAGNASGVVDGAAAMIICRNSTATNMGLTPLARIVGWGCATCPPDIMGWGPVPATKQALECAGLTGDRIHWVELNEAFAPQALACIKGFAKMGIDPEKVNPYGGAIALGHPLGATGAILTLTAAYGLRRTGKRYALVTMCIGGGQGISLIIENPRAA